MYGSFVGPSNRWSLAMTGFHELSGQCEMNEGDWIDVATCILARGSSNLNPGEQTSSS